MDWGAVDITLLVIGALLGATLCFVFLLSRARSTTTRSGARPQDRQAFEQALAEELERARRHERPLTLVRIPWDAADGRSEEPSVLGSVALRRIDRTFSLGNGTFLIAPETGAVAKEALLARLREACDERSAVTLRAATFPDDGLSSGALLATCEDEAPTTTPTDHLRPSAPVVTQHTANRRRVA